MNKLCLLLVMFTGAAIAQETSADRVPAELRSCVRLERNTERLACYDRGIAVLTGTGGAVAPSAESSFGLVATTPPPKASQPDADSGEIRTIRARIVGFNSSSEGSLLVTLDNGQVWRQLSGGQLLLKVGDDVQIERAALGSFQMKVPSGRSGKFKRVR
jgi:hypothetical protein